MAIETAREMIRESKKNARKALAIDDNVISSVLVQLDEWLSTERAAIFVEYEISGVKALTAQDVISAVKSQFNILVKTISASGRRYGLLPLF